MIRPAPPRDRLQVRLPDHRIFEAPIFTSLSDVLSVAQEGHVPAVAATITCLPLVWWEAGKGQMILPDTTGWLLILYAGLLPSLISQVLYIKGVEVIGANRAGLFINLVPVFGTLLSVTLLGETLETFHILALALVLGGIAIAEWGKPPERTARHSKN